MTDPRYPIGQFAFDQKPTGAGRKKLIDELGSQPGLLRTALAGLSDAQLDTPYRDGGWTPRQIAHHAADASLNWYVRLKLALTEDHPRIAPFDQDRWAELTDARTTAPDLSLGLLDAVHGRIVAVLRPLAEKDWSRVMNHPERGEITVDYGVQFMHWHTRHHTEQIRALRRQRGW